MRNTFIDLLAAYGPVADGNAMYDELVAIKTKRTGHAPLEVPEEHSSRVAGYVSGADPVSVILTGTAGDGKTYTARKAFKVLTGGEGIWTGEQEQSVTLTSPARRVTFVKDLSEVDPADKAMLFPRLLASLSGETDAEVFVICANDGHLLRTWREHGGGDPRAQSLLKLLAEMLRDDQEKPSAGERFRLINMSRRSHGETLGLILDGVLKHEGWSSCPSGCPALNASSPCPILLNRDVLREEGTATLRSRLRQLIEIAAADNDHLSLRQVLILVVNALLGDAKDQSRPLLTCSKARSRARDNDYGPTNPFANLLGENHPKSARDRIGAFVALRRWGVGEETNNRFDDALLDPEPTTSLPDHPHYGTSLIREIRASYIEHPSEHIASLRPLLRDQRRRLFFTAEDAASEIGAKLDPWCLTLLHSGRLYVNLLRRADEQDSAATANAKRILLRGLNRTLTGSLTDTSDAFWLTQPSGVFMGQEVPLLLDEPLRWVKKGRSYVLDLLAPSRPGRPPRLVVLDERSQGLVSALDLTPTLFEYLARVADGALPTSFSSQCLQDIRSFQIRTAGALDGLERAQDRRLAIRVVVSSGSVLRHEAFPLEEDRE